MGAREFSRGRRIVARLPHGGDLLREIIAAAAAAGMRTAELRAIGALQTARLSFYDQAAHKYDEFAIDYPTEIAALLGTVSLRDGALMVHAHATLAAADGSCRGGHLIPGCLIFACELVLQELVGEPLERVHDPLTGIPLWNGL